MTDLQGQDGFVEHDPKRRKSPIEEPPAPPKPPVEEPPAPDEPLVPPDSPDTPMREPPEKPPPAKLGKRFQARAAGGVCLRNVEYVR